MKILIFGLGSIGRRHARCFKTLGISHVAGFDPDSERRAQFKSETGGPVFSAESEGLAFNPDLVVVASPNIFHIQQAKLAATADKPMLIEKPLGTDLFAARELCEMIEARGLYAHVGSNWKFHPAFQTMKAWLNKNRIGIPTGVQALAGQWLPDWHPWEDYRGMYSARRDLGGGAIFDSHEIDYMLWLLGPVNEFCGFKAQSGVLEIETEDVAAALFRFENNALGVLITDYIQRFPRRRYHISGSEGTIEWDYADGHVRLHKPGEPDAECIDARLSDNNEMYLVQAQWVLEDLKTGRMPVTPVSAMLRVLDLQIRWHEQILNSLS
jgi:predicted dehydrogenase